MAFKQPRVPGFNEKDGVPRYIKTLVLFLKDFCQEVWVANRQSASVKQLNQLSQQIGDKLGNNEQAADSAKLGGKEPSAYALSADLGKIGEYITGTVLSATCPNEGVATEIGYINLTKGTWLIVAGGYTPIPNGQTASNYPTTFSINAGNFFGILPLRGLYAFECFSIKQTDVDVRISVTLTNWESTSFTSLSNWDLLAIRLSN